MRAAHALLLLLASCEAPDVPAGGQCEQPWDCGADLICFEGTCRPRFGAGERCDPTKVSYERHCEYGLECAPEGVCVTLAELETRRQAAEREREAELLRASGLAEERVEAEMGAAEITQPPPGPGLAVRVVHTSSRGTALAACREDERLVGGGCRSSANVRGSYPSHAGASDTVGARWNCEAGGPAEVEAWALCQALPAP